MGEFRLSQVEGSGGWVEWGCRCITAFDGMTSVQKGLRWPLRMGSHREVECCEPQVSFMSRTQERFHCMFLVQPQDTGRPDAAGTSVDGGHGQVAGCGLIAQEEGSRGQWPQAGRFAGHSVESLTQLLTLSSGILTAELSGQLARASLVKAVQVAIVSSFIGALGLWQSWAQWSEWPMCGTKPFPSKSGSPFG